MADGGWQAAEGEDAGSVRADREQGKRQGTLHGRAREGIGGGRAERGPEGRRGRGACKGCFWKTAGGGIWLYMDGGGQSNWKREREGIPASVLAEGACERWGEADRAE